MEKIPNEVLLMIFGYLEVKDLLRCATVSKSFQVMAYDTALWQKLPINLVLCQVPVGFVRHILKLGTAYLSLRLVEIVGDPIQLCEANTLKYLYLRRLGGNHQSVIRNLLTCCTQLEKLSFYMPTGSNPLFINETCQFIRQNSKSLKCLQISGPYTLNEMETENFANDISKCEQLEEISLEFARFDRWSSIQKLFQKLPGNLKKVHFGNWLKIEDLKVLVATNSELEQLLCPQIDCDDEPYRFGGVTIHKFDEIISIIVESPLCDKLIKIKLGMYNGIFVHEQFDAKCHELRKMRNLKEIDIYCEDEEDLRKAKHLLRINLPHLMVLQQHNFFRIPYFDGLESWGKKCHPLNLFPETKI